MKELKKRESGVLLHISSLPGEYGCGNFGKEARRFADFLAAAGFTYWQVLPFCMPDEYNSPYASYGAFSGNPNFIDPEPLQQMGLLTVEELEEARQHQPYICEFKRLQEERVALLRKAAFRLPDREPVYRFLKEHPKIEEFARYMALREKNGDTPQSQWDPQDFDPEEVYAQGFIQYIFYTQWEELKAYINQQGIRVIGDIPIYVALNSADVFFHPELFQLQSDGSPAFVAGVPPDFFSADGQLWGNPLYRWKTMAKDGFSWWRERMTHLLSCFDGVRIDHFRGFEAYFAVPAGEKTARNGKWHKGPGRPFVRMLQEVSGQQLIIAEDLGVTTQTLRELLEYSGFPGMRVFQFGFSDNPEDLHLPHSYPIRSVAYSGTHDNNTLLGFLWESDDERRNQIFRYCGYEGNNIDVGYRAVLRTLFRSASAIVILPLQDLLIYGADTRMNTPGTANGNWSYRFTKEQLDGIDLSFFRELNRIYGRLPSEASQTT